MRVLVVNHVSLDGVMQGPGRPDEDDRDGFPHGGWSDVEVRRFEVVDCTPTDSGVLMATYRPARDDT